MSGELRITALHLVGAEGRQTYEFPRRVTVITGPVGAGKTSILNAIKYGLGGNWTPPKKIRPALVAVELEGQIEGQRFTICRPLRGATGTASVALGEDAPELLPIRGEELSLSTLLLTRLGLPIVRVPEKLKNPTEEDRAVTFSDVLSFMYLDQEQIDGTIGYSGDRHVKWRQTFEVIYGFTTSEIAKTQAELGKANSDLARVRRYVKEVERFLAAVELPTDEEDEARRARLVTQLAVVDRELAALRARNAAPSEHPLRQRLIEAERRLDQARVAVQRAVGRLDAMRRVAAQLELDLAATARAAEATVLRELEFEQCPRCMSAIPEERVADESTCRVCLQPEPPAPAALALEKEELRLRRQQLETRRLREEADRDYETAVTALVAMQAARDATAREWDAAAAEAGAPELERAASLGQQRGEVTRAIETVDRTARMRAELESAKEERQRLSAETSRLVRKLEGMRAQQRRARHTVGDLGTAYHDLLRQMELQDLEEAGVDPKLYLPLVNGETIPALSSGGMKTTASFAFFLASLKVRLGGESLLPKFMMLDSPRKGHGKNEVDEASMARFYRTLWTFTQLRSAFQVIVADNDTPLDGRDDFHIIALTSDRRSVDIARLTGRGT